MSYEKKGIGKYFKVTKKFYDYFKLDVQEDDFRDKANKNITEFLEEMPVNESKEEDRGVLSDEKLENPINVDENFEDSEVVVENIETEKEEVKSEEN